jgi:hypothetical protein
MGGRDYIPGWRRAALSAVGTEGPSSPGRRHFFREVAMHGASIPVVHFALSASFGGEARGAPGSARSAASESRPGRPGPDFSSPYLELARRLREAAQIEQALMLQYFYAAASPRSAYLTAIDSRTPGSVDLAGVAMQKMQHLATVNRLLVALGVEPTLLPAEFPYDLEAYPFTCALAPLSRKSLAEYLYAEAPAALFAPNAPAKDHCLARTVKQVVGRNTRAVHVGGLYDAILASLADCAATGLGEEVDVEVWLERLRAVKAEGEDGHFNFFRGVFEAHHQGIAGRVEGAPAAPRDMTTIVSRRGTIDTSALPALNRLGDLHYWTVLLLLDLHFRESGEQGRFLEMARMQMLGPVRSLARHLPTLGSSIEFHPLSLGFTPRADTAGNCLLAAEMLREARVKAEKIGNALPPDYPVAMIAPVLRELAGMTRSSQRHAAARRLSAT